MRSRWGLFRVVVGLVLVVAAIFKTMNIAEILAADGLLSSRTMLLAVIGLESGIGVYVLIGSMSSTWIIAFATFGALAASAAYALISGKTCNCFGGSIGPRLTLPMDLVVLGLIACSRPELSNDRKFSKRTLSCSLLAGVCLVAVATHYERSIDIGNPIEFLLADTVVGKRWPLGATFHRDLEELDHNDWMVFVLRHDCEHCIDMVSRYFANPKFHRPNERTAVFVAGRNNWLFELDRISLDVKTGTEISWNSEPFVASPAIFLLSNGNVVDGADGREADELLQRLFR